MIGPTNANAKYVKAIASSTNDHVVTFNGTNGNSIKDSGFTIAKSVPSNAVFTDTWTAMVGATSSANGSVGYVNAVPPKNGYNTKYLRADGTWSVPAYPTVNNGTLTVTQNGTSKGTFTANQSGNSTIALTDTTYSAGTGLSLSGTTINHSNSVTAETTGKGSATAIPIIKYDAQGHITSVTTATVYPPTTAGTNGQLWKSDGSGAGVWVNQNTLTPGVSIASDSGTSTVDMVANTTYKLTVGASSVIFKTPSDANTTNSCGAGNSTAKLFIVGRSKQSTGTSNSNSAVYMENGTVTATDFVGKHSGYTLGSACQNNVDNTTTTGSLMNLTTYSASTNLVTRNTIAYWDGRYQTTNNSSNLSYCKKGAFGDACTKGVTTNMTSGSTALFTSGGAYAKFKTAISSYNYFISGVNFDTNYKSSYTVPIFLAVSFSSGQDGTCSIYMGSTTSDMRQVASEAHRGGWSLTLGVVVPVGWYYKFTKDVDNKGINWVMELPLYVP